MQYGVCTGPQDAAVFALAGFNYIELNLRRDLMPEARFDAFEPALTLARRCGLPTPAANCMLPRELPVTGPNVDLSAVERYLQGAFAHAQQAGVHTVVFGSGGARSFPDAWTWQQAWDQLVAFGRRLGPLAKQRDIVVVVEPLNSRESNILNTVEEAAQLVRAVDHPHLQILVDAYHFFAEEEDLAALDGCATLIHHVHVATYRSRLAPGREPCDFVPFMRKLHEIGYAGRVSIEGAWETTHMIEDARRARDVLRDAQKGSPAP